MEWAYDDNDPLFFNWKELNQIQQHFLQKAPDVVGTCGGMHKLQVWEEWDYC